MYEYGRADNTGFMYNHVETEHEGMKGPGEGAKDFRAEIVARDKDCLRRIVREAVRIKKVADGKEFKIVEVKNTEVEGENTHDRETSIRVPVTLINTKEEWFAPQMTALGVTRL